MKKKKLLTLATLPTLALLLAGCGNQATPSHGKPGGLYGMLYNILGVPMQHLMEWMAGYLGHSYGMAIIVLVIVVRLILLPVMFSQMKKSTEMQERMNKLQPTLKKLQEKQKQATTPEEQAAVGQQMMAVYRNNNVNMLGGVGCLPLLIQLPVFSALYMAIQYFPEMAHQTFLGIPLGRPSLLLAILSFVVYLIQAALAMVGVPQEQKKQMGATMLMSPVMTFIIAISSSAGLGLYFFIGGLFAILQTLMVNAARPRIRRRIEKEMKDHPVTVPDVSTPSTSAQSPQTADAISQLRADGSNASHNNQQRRSTTNGGAKAPADATASERRNRQRNAGKQQHHAHHSQTQSRPVTKHTKPVQHQNQHEANRRRNAGKQRHHRN